MGNRYVNGEYGSKSQPGGFYIDYSTLMVNWIDADGNDLEVPEGGSMYHISTETFDGELEVSFTSNYGAYLKIYCTTRSSDFEDTPKGTDVFLGEKGTEPEPENDNIFVGNTPISNVFVGGLPVSKMYVGGTQVF